MPILPARIPAAASRTKKQRDLSGGDLNLPGEASQPSAILPNMGKDLEAGIQTFANSLDKYQARVDTAKITDAENDFINYVGEKKREVEQLKGENAIGVTAASAKFFDSNLGINNSEEPVESPAGLKYQDSYNSLNSKQRGIFNQRVATQRNPYLNTASRIEQNQSQIFFDESYTAAVATEVDKVQRDPTNIEQIESARDRLTELAISNGVEKGHSPERVGLEIQEKMGNIHGGVIEGLILQRDFEVARGYLRSVDHEVSSKEKFRMMGDILTAEDAGAAREKREKTVRQQSTLIEHLVAIKEGDFDHTKYISDGRAENLSAAGFMTISNALKEDVVSDPEALNAYLQGLETPEIRNMMDPAEMAMDRSLSVADRIKMIDRRAKRIKATSVEESTEYKLARKKFSAAYVPKLSPFGALTKAQEKRRLAAEEEFQFRVFDAGESPKDVINDMIANEDAFKKNSDLRDVQEKNLFSTLPPNLKHLTDQGHPDILKMKEQLEIDIKDGLIAEDDIPDLVESIHELDEFAQASGRQFTHTRPNDAEIAIPEEKAPEAPESQDRAPEDEQGVITPELRKLIDAFDKEASDIRAIEQKLEADPDDDPVAESKLAARGRKAQEDLGVIEKMIASSLSDSETQSLGKVNEQQMKNMLDIAAEIMEESTDEAEKTRLERAILVLEFELRKRGQ